jgi:hypothetical protein
MAKVPVIALKPLYYLGHHVAGAKLQMEEQDVERHVALKLVTTADAVLSAEEEVADGSLDGSLEALRAAWTVEMSPADYLKQFPTGPFSDLAMAIVDFEAESEQQEAVSPISLKSILPE